MNIYKNGNTIVGIGEDGTKVRYIPDNTAAAPEFPESIDMKITNRCDVGCPQCHECSVPDGKLADLNHPLLNTLRPYTEIAVGGGDPMTHPDLEAFLRRMREQKVISNITVHWTSFLQHYETLKLWTQEGLIHGLGVSINEIVPANVIEKLAEFRHAVVHTIIGIAGRRVYGQLIDKDFNILLLGYKTFGRGQRFRTDHSDSIFRNISWLKEHLGAFPDHFRAVSFDNLAIEQTELESRLSPDVFRRIYMGGDGTFTMYVDLVENQFAVSSTRERRDLISNDILDLFAAVRDDVAEAL